MQRRSNRSWIGIVILAVAVEWAILSPATAAEREPFAMHLTAPIKTWDEAIPLGNGLTGVA